MEQQETTSGVIRLSREEILESAIFFDIIERPVCVLATSVDILEWLLMKQGAQSVLLHHFLKNFHGDHVLIDGSACIIADRAYLELIKCYFIVLRLERNSYLMQFSLHLQQGYSHSLW